ncbi:MAG: M28 family peptidase [Patescibacteria group bacterium]
MLDIAEELVALGERQGDTAILAADTLARRLKEKNIEYQVETIDTWLPVASSSLTVDGKNVDSAPTSFIGGNISGKDALVSSLIPTRYLIDMPNINFNPRSRALSLPNFYFAPSLAVRSQDVDRILAGTKIEGVVEVEKRQYALPQLLVGNSTDPANIVFSHYDSIGPGAIDNASGTAVSLSLAMDADFRKNTLFVFDPNEELSYDHPTYWGHGYRVFESRHADLLEKASRILVIDCVGNGVPQAISDPRILNLAFPILGLEKLLDKTLTIGGDIEKMLEVYQSDIDFTDLLTEKYLLETKDLIAGLLKG